MRHLVLLGVTHFPGTDEQVKGKPTAATGLVKRQARRQNQQQPTGQDHRTDDPENPGGFHQIIANTAIVWWQW